MIHNYFIKTNRLGVSEWKRELHPFALLLWGNPVVSKYITMNDYFSEEDINNRLIQEISNKELYNVQYYPLFELETNTFIGCCGLRPYDTEKSFYEFGFYLLPEFWGKGYANEASKAIIEYSINTVDIKNIYAGHHPDNLASKKSIRETWF